MTIVESAKDVTINEAAWVSRTLSPLDAETCDTLRNLNSEIVWVVGEIRVENNARRSAGQQGRKWYVGAPSCHMPLDWPDEHSLVGHTRNDSCFIEYADGESRLQISVMGDGTRAEVRYRGPTEGRLWDVFGRLS